MFFHTCKDTVAPCVIKQLYFMYALLISVPIINCVNNQCRWVWLFVSTAAKSAHNYENSGAWSWHPACMWSGLVKVVLPLVKFDSFPCSLQFTWADVGVSEQGRSSLCFWSLAIVRAVVSRHWEFMLHQPYLRFMEIISAHLYSFFRKLALISSFLKISA